ncbi:iron-containing alcohol dehydrogenase [Arthrobacter sp. 2MCAF14]|uniref:iron-containing alcohol dehydrogenase n=1 Tax=Arthrobacter sp. 2MCAF14 TaxID=3232982 RepID=UPI003F921167
MHDLQRLLFNASKLGRAPHLLEGSGASSALSKIVGRSPRRVLVVASRRTVEEVPGLASLIRHGAHHYGLTRPNPSVDDALDLSQAIEEIRPNTVLAVGGGSAIDQAKAARLLKPALRFLDSGLRGDTSSLRAEPPLLVAVPTTAGTGAEMTPFATLYRGSTKVSLDLPRCRPDLAVLDGELTLTCPDRHSLAAVLDAVCHAIESGWSLASTPSSRVYANAARDHLLAHLTHSAPPSPDLPSPGGRWADHSPASDSGRHLLLLATAVAGVAISQTRTTGAHAFAYHLTAAYGVPHGFACAASMSWIEAQARARQPETVDEATRTAVAALRKHLDGARTSRLVTLPSLDGAALEDYVDAGLNVRSRMATHPVPIERAEAVRHIGRDGRLGGNSAAKASRKLPQTA